MPLLQAEAQKLEVDDFQRGIIEEIIDHEDLFSILPFTKTAGKAYIYNRENTLGTADWMSPVIDTVPESSADFTEVMTSLKIVGSQVEVDRFLDETNSTQNAQKAVQIAAKAKMMGRTFREAMTEGSVVANPKQFDGMSALVDPAQVNTVGAGAGAALTMSHLDELVDAVPNGCDALFMREGTIRAYRALLRTTGSGSDALTNQVAQFNGSPILHHNGIPILTNNFQSGVEDQGGVNTCSIYAVRLNEFDGLHGLYGGDSPLGVRFEELGTHANKDATTYRIIWYCGMALKSTKSLAALRGITNI